MLFLPALEGWRGFAALLVVLYHFSKGSAGFYQGYLAVDFFFILSGFVLSYTYEKDIRSGDLNFKSFIIRRFARLYPMYAFGTLLIINIPSDKIFPINLNDGSSVIAQILLLQSIMGINPWLLAAWSVSVEWIISIVFFLFTRAGKAGTRHRAVTCVWILLLLAAMYNLYKCCPGRLDMFYMDMPGISLPLWRGIAGFSIGVLIYRTHDHIPYIGRRWLYLLEIIILGLIVFKLNVSYPPYLYYDDGFLLAVLPILLMLVLDGRSMTHAIGKLSPSVWLGRRSYAIYILHRPVEYGILVSGIWLETQNTIWQILTLVACVLAVSSFAYRFIEMPSRNWLRKFA